ncbi:MAG: prolyl-tRNA synthetase [Trebouxia sp. A1-2]|nr:MAG: prolyl-tRNA synthetase [Trebouxia sp. A1-2]
MSCSARDLLAQELALKLRAEGKTYKPQKAKKSSIKAETASAPFRTSHSSNSHQQGTQSAQHQQQGSQQQSNTPQREETGTRPEGDVQVIIVPIFWNKKADEKTTVVAAAEEVQQHLQEVGIQVGLDTTNADTPGQKYRYWEQKGVKVRIELGPRDAHKSQACLAISTTPGEVAKKASYQIGAQLTTAVQKALTASGIIASTETVSKATDSQLPQPSGKKNMSAKKQKHQLDRDAVGKAQPNSKAEEVDKNTVEQSVRAEASVQASPAKAPAAGAPQRKSSKTHLPSGDDLGDEFAIEIDAAEDEGAKKKKKRPLEASVTETVVADGNSKAAQPKKSKAKVVKF